MADNNWDFSFNEFSADDEELSIDLESFYSILGEDPDPMQSYCFKAWRRCGKNLVLLPNFFWKIQKFINTYCYCIKLLAQILYSDEL
uniref:Uncharacterized protein n=1 Tax=Vitis vinifera TaxID=29760 RepID=F6GZ86_VITVI